METSLNVKEVSFFEWCPKCKHYDTEEVEDPCNDCLTQGWNVNTTKPVNFAEKDE